MKEFFSWNYVPLIAIILGGKPQSSHRVERSRKILCFQTNTFVLTIMADPGARTSAFTVAGTGVDLADDDEAATTGIVNNSVDDVKAHARDGESG